MKKLIAIVAGDPESINTEIIAKAWKKKQQYNNINIFIIGNFNLLKKQFNLLKIKIDIKKISNFNSMISFEKLLVYDVPLEFKEPFKINIKHKKKYILNCFEKAIELSNLKRINGFVNCPVNKKHIFKSNYGVTEFLAKKSNILGKEAMIIYNKKLSVCPITTHIQVKNVSKNLSIKSIFQKVMTVNSFYLKRFGFKPKICILGLNPHNYELRNKSEEKKIILPAIIKLKKRGIKVTGPLPADTAFAKTERFNIVIGMYHDQVLTPYKAIFKFNAINVTAGLPYVRVSPDHGTGQDIIKKNLASPMSLIESIKFFKLIDV